MQCTFKCLLVLHLFLGPTVLTASLGSNLTTEEIREQHTSTETTGKSSCTPLVIAVILFIIIGFLIAGIIFIVCSDQHYLEEDAAKGKKKQGKKGTEQEGKFSDKRITKMEAPFPSMKGGRQAPPTITPKVESSKSSKGGSSSSKKVKSSVGGNSASTVKSAVSSSAGGGGKSKVNSSVGATAKSTVIKSSVVKSAVKPSAASGVGKSKITSKASAK